MRVFITVAMTADGFIAQHADHLATQWTSKADKRQFVRLTKEAGTMVMGLRTYLTFGHPLPGRRNIVYSDQPVESVETTTETPQDLVRRLESEGVETLAVCGGASIYTQFMQAGVVDEVYIDVEPVVFGNGISLFNTSLDVKLRLISAEPLNEQGTVLHHYAVEK
ncbi:MAG TPA: dihydrofolate reductase family protein [Patescibacteria group bacterium]|nr:dihydrofolate reductase family protein [Patescibacteria group bacterium]